MVHIQIGKGREIISKMKAEGPSELVSDAFNLLRRIKKEGTGYRTSETDKVELMLSKFGLVEEHFVDTGSAMLFVEADRITKAGNAVLAALSNEAAKGEAEKVKVDEPPKHRLAGLLRPKQ